MRIEHIAIWAKNIEVMKDFYVKYFNGIAGEKYHNPKKQFESYFITFDTGSRLELMAMKTIKNLNKEIHEQYYGIAHIAFSFNSKEEVNNLTEQLKKDNYIIAGEPRLTGDGYYESCILDPEGNRLEIMVHPS